MLHKNKYSKVQNVVTKINIRKCKMLSQKYSKVQNVAQKCPIAIKLRKV